MGVTEIEWKGVDSICGGTDKWQDIVDAVMNIHI
jgi:hypothetical protein